MALSDIVVATIINWIMAPLLALTPLRGLLAPEDAAVETGLLGSPQSAQSCGGLVCRA